MTKNGELAESFDGMVGELVLKDKIKSTFGKYVDPRVVENLMDGDDSLETGGAKEDMTVVFTEFDFHALKTATLAPADLVRMINDCLTALSAPVSKHKGVIDKFIDSMVMSFWGPPFTAESAHATMACKAVLEQLQSLDTLQKRLQSELENGLDVPAANIYVGVSTGPLVVGNMGSQQSMSYTVLGDTVNIASRLKGACKIYGVGCLIVEETRSMIAGEMETREIDMIQVVGKEEPVRIYELLGIRGETAAPTLKRRDIYEDGLLHYRNQDWELARARFEECLALDAKDGPARSLIERLDSLSNVNPGDNWDGVWELTKK